MGLRPERLGAGLRWGGIAFVVVGGAIVVAGSVSGATHLFTSSRTEVSLSRMWFEALVAIPLGTVVLEELAFRGVLLGLLLTRLRVVPAVTACSILFGLWHVQGAVTTTSGSTVHVVGAVAGTVVATTTAGVVFCWLRLRSQSLLASALAHLATNSVALATAWYVAH